MGHGIAGLAALIPEWSTLQHRFPSQYVLFSRFFSNLIIKTEKESFGEKNSYMLKTVKIETVIKNIFEDMLYLPIVSSFVFFFDKIRRLQTGKINAYLLYMMITIVLLLLFARLSNA